MRALNRLLPDGHLKAALLASLASLSTKLAAAAAGVVLTFLIARRFGAAGSGAWVLGTTILTIAGYACLCGLDYSTTRAIAIHRAADRWSAARSWTWTGLLIIATAGAPITLIVYVVSPWLARTLSEGPLFATVMQTMALAIAPYAIIRFSAGAFRGVRRFALADALDSGVVSAGLVASILLLNIHSLTNVAQAYVAISVVAALGGLSGWLLGLRGRPSGSDPMAVREALAASLPLAGTVLATLASPWIVTLFLAKFATTAEVGVYRVALQFALLLGFLLNAAETGLSPQIAALHSQQKLNELSNAAKRITGLLILLGGLPALTLLLFSGWFLGIMGPEFPQGATAMRILIAAQIFNLATGPVGTFMVMTGLGRLSFYNALASTVLVLALGVLLVPQFGTVGAAVASAAATVFRNLTATIIVWRRHGLFLPLGIVRAGPARP
jgi:O-antigen/teichoic acid export membrane protein